MRLRPYMSIIAMLVMAALVQGPFMLTTADRTRPVEEPTPLMDRALGPIDHPPSRGGLVLMAGESQVLTGPHQYTFTELGPGSRLVLESCDLNITGDVFNDPVIWGSPSTFVVRNSTLTVWGLSATTLSRSGGQNASLSLTSLDTLEVTSSTITIKGGNGLPPSKKGIYFEGRISGTMFKGGNASFDVGLKGEGSCRISGSKLKVIGGKGGDAPDGEQLNTFMSNDLPGGYTLGGDVSGEAGRGGTVSLKMNTTGSDLTISGSGVEVIGGRGANAGNGGYFFSPLPINFDDPLPAGGYTAGMYTSSRTVKPGNVSGNVGRGGEATLDIASDRMEMTGVIAVVAGGGGGDPGMPGSGISIGHAGISYVRAGMGGGGYAGGGSTPGGGQDGGAVRDLVGSGGDAILNISVKGELLQSDIDLLCQGGSGGYPYEGGWSGCVETYPYNRGGGGGGGGFSAGAGGGLSDIGYSKNGGSAGPVDRTVGRGGNSSLSLEARYSSGRGWQNVSSEPGMAFNNSPLDGQDSVSRSTGEVLAEGGGARVGSVIQGRSKTAFVWPAPFMVSPAEGGYLHNIYQQFTWERGSLSCGPGPYYVFRLLRSPDPDDILFQKAFLIETQFRLDEDPGDGTYWWTVKVEGNQHYSLWARPRMFMIDREPPLLEQPSGRTWENGTLPSLTITAYDKVSGISGTTALYKVQRKGTVSSEWYPATVGETSPSNFTLKAELPSVQGDYEVFFKVTDRAGNGPAIGGPFNVSIDTTPPLVTDPSPTGWCRGTVHLSFDMVETGVGPIEDVLVSAEGGTPWSSLIFSSPLVTEGGIRRTMRDGLTLSEGPWTLTITVHDLVGNRGTYGPFFLDMDLTAPLVLLLEPGDGVWTNVSRPTFSFGAAEQGSGLVSAEVRVRGPTRVAERSYQATNGPGDAWSVTVPDDLKDGTNSWCAVARDAVGNEMASPWRILGVDTKPPVVLPPTSYVVENEVILLRFAPVSELSGLTGLEVQTMTGTSSGWNAAISYPPIVPVMEPEGTLRAEVPIPSGPLSFMRVRGTDAAGNIGLFCDVFRVDILETDFGMEVPHDTFVRSGAELNVTIHDVLGIELSSVEVLVHTRDGKTYRPAFSSGVMQRGPTHSMEGDQHVLSAAVSLDTSSLSGPVTLEVLWKSIVPMGEGRSARGSGPTFDRDDPELELFAPSFGPKNPFVIMVKVSDRTSGVDIDSMTVEVGKGNVSRCNVFGGPTLNVGEGGEHILSVALTWGVRTEVIVTVRDRVGHTVSKLAEVLSTRPPEVEIRYDMPLKGSFVMGEAVRLEAHAYDPDLESVSFRWAVNGVQTGEGPVLDIILREARTNVTVYATDGHHTVTDSLELEAYRPDRDKEPFPYLIVIVLFVVLSVVLFLVIATALFLVFRKSRESSGDDEEEAEEWGVEEGRAGKKRGTASGGKLYSGPGSSKAGGGGGGCGICLKGLKAGTEHPRCRCGSRFHRACALREGVCPDCGREILLKAE